MARVNEESLKGLLSATDLQQCEKKLQERSETLKKEQ
jgi:hypothetical protein